jgi:hypothetical protein
VHTLHSITALSQRPDQPNPASIGANGQEGRLGA